MEVSCASIQKIIFGERGSRSRCLLPLTLARMRRVGESRGGRSAGGGRFGLTTRPDTAQTSDLVAKLPPPDGLGTYGTGKPRFLAQRFERLQRHTDTSRRNIEGRIGHACDAHFSCGADPPMPVSEVQGLLAMFVAAGGDGWHQKDGWGAPQFNAFGLSRLSRVRTDPGTWYGVLRRGGHVVAVRLAKNRLDGRLSEHVCDLVRLEALRLEDNRLEQGLPERGLGRLQCLRELCLNNNRLTGPIPDDLGLLVNLERLQLNDNQLSGPIPASLGNMSGLLLMWLHRNRLSGYLPPSLGLGLRSVRQLYLYENMLEGEIPPELARLDQLEELWLNDNYFSGRIPPELGRLPRLRELNLRGNRLEGDVPNRVLEMPQEKTRSLFLFQHNHRTASTSLVNWMDTTSLAASVTI